MKPSRIPLTANALLALSLLAIGCSAGGSGGSTPVSGPAVTFSASSLIFTGTDSGYATAPQTLTITNSGTTPLIISNEQTQGADATYFTGVGGGIFCATTTTLAPQASCRSQVEFTPTAVRTYSATLTFTDNAPNSPQSVALSGTLGASTAPVATAQFGYVMNYNGIVSSYTIGPTGAWTPTTPASVSIGDTAGAMVIDPLGKYLFTAGFLSGEVLSYSITPGSGVLVPAGSSTTSVANTRPENMAIDPTGTFLYLSNTGVGTVTEYTVNRASGALTQGATTTVPLYPGQQFSEPEGLVTDPTGHYLYVSAVGYIAAYSIDTTTGAIAPLATPTVQGAPAFDLVLDPTGKYLYFSNTYVLTQYAINASNGTLTDSGNITSTSPSPTEIGMTPNGKYAYVTDRQDGSISLYTGNFVPLSPSTVSQAGEPFTIAIDPSNQFAYVVLEASGINVMTINSDGTLSHQNTVSVASPVAIAIYP